MENKVGHREELSQDAVSAEISGDPTDSVDVLWTLQGCVDQLLDALIVPGLGWLMTDID